MLEYPRWKYMLVVVVLLLALLLALPNVFGEDPALQVARKDHNPMTADARRASRGVPARAQRSTSSDSYIDSGRLMVRFANVADQLEARDAVNEQVRRTYITALSFAPRTPAFLRALGLRPMPLGLDLRGGLYLLYQVDVNAAVTQLLEGYAQDAAGRSSAANIPFKDVTTSPRPAAPNTRARGAAARADLTAARGALNRRCRGCRSPPRACRAARPSSGSLTAAQIRERQDYAIQQNIVTLRNRVNELGVSEPIVQRQGLDRINVQLPGVQNSAEVKDILGKRGDARVPPGGHAEQRRTRRRRPATRRWAPSCTRNAHGRRCCSSARSSPPAMSSPTPPAATDQEGPAVNIKLDARARREHAEDHPRESRQAHGGGATSRSAASSPRSTARR